MTTDPFTEAANAAAREYARTPRMNVGTVQDRIGEAHAAGWEAARTHLAAQEPTQDEVLAALNAQGIVVSPKMRPAPSLDYWGDKPAEAMRAALSAARAARRDEKAPAAPAMSLKQRIRDLHTADEETENCIYCTRGRIYPVPAPCATVRLLEDEATR